MIKHAARGAAGGARRRRLGRCPGRVPDSQWSPLTWYTRLQRFHGRAPTRGGRCSSTRPLLYSKLESSARLGCPGAGARVRGGAAPTGADRQQYQERSRLSHGGGAGPVVGAHERYDRFSMDRVVRIPAIIARVDEGDGAAPPSGMLLAWVAAMRTTSPRSRRRTWALARRR